MNGFSGPGSGAGQSPPEVDPAPSAGDQPQKMSHRGWQPLVQLPSSVPEGVAAPWTPASSTVGVEGVLERREH